MPPPPSDAATRSAHKTARLRRHAGGLCNAVLFALERSLQLHAEEHACLAGDEVRAAVRGR